MYPEVISGSVALWAGSHSPALVIVTGLMSIVWGGPPSFGVQLGMTETGTEPANPPGRVSSSS